MNELATNKLIEDGGIDRKSITVGAMVQAFFTVLSRVFGMIRDVMVTHIFGAGAVTDAFFVAFTIPNVLRQFFGEGAFSMTFVPIYIATKKNGDGAARLFFRDAFGFLLCMLIVVVIIGVLCSTTLVHMFAHGFADNGEQFVLTDRMTKWLFPYVLMVSIVALFGALLTCYKRFAAMAAAPIMLNITMIACMALLLDRFSPPVMTLVFGVVLGGILQVIVMSVALMRAGLLAWPRLSLKSEPMQRLIKILGPALFGVFVYQLNIIVLRQLASFLGEGQISYYYNADRLTQFATGVFAVSISTAALPEISRGIAQFGRDRFYETLRFTLVITSFIITPCACGLMVFAHPLIAVIFAHGNFTVEDARITANTLMAFSPSIIAFSWSRPLIQAFYAEGNTKTPVLIGLVTVIFNLVVGLVLLRFDIVGLSITLTLSSFVQFFLLLISFKRVHPSFHVGIIKPFLSHVGIAAIACAAGFVVQLAGDWSQGFSIKNAIVLAMLSGVAGSVYFFAAYSFKLPEARKFIDAILIKFGISRRGL